MSNEHSAIKQPHNTKDHGTQDQDNVNRDAVADIGSDDKTLRQDITNQDRVSANVQRKKARSLLTILQWVAFCVLLMGLVWLYITQHRHYTEVMQRVQSNAQLTDRINVLEDKLVASSQSDSTSSNKNTTSTDVKSNQSEAQLEQVRLQLNAANILINNGQLPEAIQLLKGIHWQLQQTNNDIAPALTSVLSHSLDDDIAMLQKLSNQPSSWQSQALAIQAVQKFLYGKVYSSANQQAHSDSTGARTAPIPSLQKAIITPQDAIIYDVIMQLNLAQQAASDKDAAMLKLYLMQAVERLNLIDRGAQREPESGRSNNATYDVTNDTHQLDANSLETSSVGAQSSISVGGAGQTEHIEPSDTQPAKPSRVHTINSMSDAIRLLKQLAQQSPKPVHLTTMQVVMTPDEVVARQ